MKRSIRSMSSAKIGASINKSVMVLGEFSELFNIKFLKILLISDTLLAIAHVSSGLIFGKIPIALNVTLDWSLAECFGYVKLGGAVLLLWLAFRVSRIPVLLAFAIIFGVMVADDTMELHERLGHWAVHAFGLTGVADIRRQDIGELLAWGAMGGMLLPVFALGIIRTRPEDRVIAVRFTICAALLVFFAVGVDVMHETACAVLSGLPQCSHVFGLVEDGGEMIVQSLIFAHVLAVFQHNRGARGMSATAYRVKAVLHDRSPAASSMSGRKVP